MARVQQYPFTDGQPVALADWEMYIQVRRKSNWLRLLKLVAVVGTAAAEDQLLPHANLTNKDRVKQLCVFGKEGATICV